VWLALLIVAELPMKALPPTLPNVPAILVALKTFVMLPVLAVR
jgi:hypothetical protein